MSIEHKVDRGLQIFETEILWNMSRQEVRSKLNEKYEEHNQVISVKKFLPDSEDIISRKDIYSNFKGSKSWIVFIYNENDQLTEFEMHSGEGVSIKNLNLSFNEHIDVAKKRLKDLKINHIFLFPEEILIPEFKTLFASAEHMGGDGKKIQYIYCSQKIDHLEKPQQ